MCYKNIHEIQRDSIFIEYVSLRNIGPRTQEALSSILLKYTKIQHLDLQTLIKEADDEEEAGIRLKRRKLKTRLIKYRKTLIDEGYANSTIIDYFNKVKTFYRTFDLEIPVIPPISLPRHQIDFYEIPNKEDILKVVKSTSNKKHRAIILFQFSSCSGMAETLSITNQMFIDAVSEYTHETDINRVIPDLIRKQKELREENNGIVPLFMLYRIKEAPYNEGGYKYFTACTPECVDYILDYMDERISQETLTNEDKLFDIKTHGLKSAYSRLNDKNGFPIIGSYRFFRSHNMRKAGNNAINNIGFADAISGRKRDDIHERYFLHDPKKIKEEYLEYIEDLTLEPTKIIYAAETTEEVKKLRTRVALLESEKSDLKHENTEQNQFIDRKRELNRDLSNRINNRPDLINEWFSECLNILNNYRIHPNIEDKLELDTKIKNLINERYDELYDTNTLFLELKKIVQKIIAENESKIEEETRKLQNS